MDVGEIVRDLGAAAEQMLADPALPSVAPKTAGGKRGYDHVIDALNRLPRPFMAIGALAVFAVAAISPDWFEARMQALAMVPEPMWWLLGAVMTCFFGAREAHYIRQSGPRKPPKA